MHEESSAMRITAGTSQYLKIVEAVSPIAAKTHAAEEEDKFDPLFTRPTSLPSFPSLPSSALEGQEDSVALSEIAQSSLDNQNKLRDQLDTRIRKLFEEQGIDFQSERNVDHSPEAVSKRIVDFSTNFYDLYLEKNPDLSEEQALDSFESTIVGAVDQGYLDAMELLEGVGLPESVVDIGRQTRTLVQEKFDAFFAEKRESLTSA